MNNKYPQRKSHRLKNFDYSSGYSYHVIINACKSESIFSKILLNDKRECEIKLTDIGNIIDKHIKEIEKCYKGVILESYVIMPNHIHILLSIIEANQQHTEKITIIKIISALKSITTKKIGEKIWQKSFYDHVIDNDKEFFNTVNYIEGNPIEHLVKEENKKTV